MMSNLSRRVEKIEQRSAASRGGDNFFHVAKPPNMTMEEALGLLGIEPEPMDMVLEAVWLGGETGKPELIGKGNFAKTMR